MLLLPLPGSSPTLPHTEPYVAELAGNANPGWELGTCAVRSGHALAPKFLDRHEHLVNLVVGLRLLPQLCDCALTDSRLAPDTEVTCDESDDNSTGATVTGPSGGSVTPKKK